jgi:hypothetical protein
MMLQCNRMLKYNVLYIIPPEEMKIVTLHKLQEMKAYMGFEGKLHAF